MIVSILTAIGMAISVLVETLLPGGEGGGGRKQPPPNGAAGVRQWVRNKLKALAMLLGRLGVKRGEVN